MGGLAVLVKFPLAARPRALPVLADPHRAAEGDRARRRGRRTPARLMCRLVRPMLRRFPARSPVFVGDAEYGTHEAARFCHRHRSRLTPVSKPHPDANRFAPPPPGTGTGRPRVGGARLPKPRRAVAATARLTPLTVGHWYKSGCGPVPIRWVLARDLAGTHRGEYFFTTGPALGPAAVVEKDTGRRNLGTTFQGCRSCSGPATTRGWCRATALRAAPCPFGRYSVAAALYHLPPAAKRAGRVEGPGKAGVTLSDAPTAVRRWPRADGVFPQAAGPAAVRKLPRDFRDLLLASLATAA